MISADLFWFSSRKDRFKSDFSLTGLTNCLDCLRGCGGEITMDADEEDEGDIECKLE